MLFWIVLIFVLCCILFHVYTCIQAVWHWLFHGSVRRRGITGVPPLYRTCHSTQHVKDAFYISILVQQQYIHNAFFKTRGAHRQEIHASIANPQPSQLSVNTRNTSSLAHMLTLSTYSSIIVRRHILVLLFENKRMIQSCTININTNTVLCCCVAPLTTPPPPLLQVITLFALLLSGCWTTMLLR